MGSAKGWQRKLGISGNVWLAYYPDIDGNGNDMGFTQINIQPDAKKSKDAKPLAFIGKAFVPDNIRANIIGDFNEVNLLEIELTWGTQAIKGKLASVGKGGEIAEKFIPNSILCSVDGKGKFNNIGVEFSKDF